MNTSDRRKLPDVARAACACLAMASLASDTPTDPETAQGLEAAAKLNMISLNGEGGDPCFGGPKNLPMVMSELYPGAASDRASAQARRAPWPPGDRSRSRSR